MSAPTTPYIDEGRAEIIIADGDLLAIHQRGRIEVWSADGETHMGNLPVDATEAAIRQAAEFWVNGFTVGTRFGRDETQSKQRAAMGPAS